MPDTTSEDPVIVLYDRDVDLDPLQARTVAIIGYGSQGHAHAQNLRDSGVPVVVGLRDGSASREVAADDGFEVLSVADAAARADVVMMLTPDETMGDVYRADVAPHLADGDLLMFAHGFNVHFGEIEAPPGVDVGMVAPKGPGHLVRRVFTQGQGVPCLFAVARDVTGRARPSVLAYAKGVGGTRAGAIETTFRDETETDLFGEQAVLCGGAVALVEAGFDTLVEAGYRPELAYFECLHELKLIVDLMYERGIGGMRDSISNTAEYGDLTRGPRVVTAETRAEMRRILDEIRDGSFAREWLAEVRAGGPRFAALRSAAAAHPVEATGARLRSMMAWIDGTDAPTPVQRA